MGGSQAPGRLWLIWVAAEAADRLALRELFDAYAHCADRRDAEGQKSLFTKDTHFVVYMEGQGV